eukprot:TRINITY_DN636_c2_g1_i3.p1 TRINITY_DN636_c2_g1~~TRINITY_DN636_c2_g1_i3.p1  ORF type:complete len:177 (-),score=65.65 TRINITY_DN636_c2_g1_i3:527-1057(-)
MTEKKRGVVEDKDKKASSSSSNNNNNQSMSQAGGNMDVDQENKIEEKGTKEVESNLGYSSSNNNNNTNNNVDDNLQELVKLKQYFDAGVIQEDVYKEAQSNRAKRREIIGLPPLQIPNAGSKIDTPHHKTQQLLPYHDYATLLRPEPSNYDWKPEILKLKRVDELSTLDYQKKGIL